MFSFKKNIELLDHQERRFQTAADCYLGAILSIQEHAIDLTPELTLAIRGLQDDLNVRNALLFIGAPAFASGIGFLISAAISNRICRAWEVRDKKGA